MIRSLILSLFLTAGLLQLSSQNIIEVEGETTYYAPWEESMADAKRKALTQAKNEILIKVFGTEVSETTSSIMSNINEKSHEHFSVISTTSLKGEWIETIGEPQYSITQDEKYLIIECFVKGRARKITESQVDFEAMTLRNAPNVKYSSDKFISGDDMYLYFKSPESGFINVFLVDNNEQEAYLLLPYKNAKESVYEVEADKEYILFSDEVAPKSDIGYVDEYVLSAIDHIEINEIYIVFSPKKFGKASMTNRDLPTVPKVTTIKKFNEWLSKLKTKNKNITTKNLTITISNDET